MSQTQPTQGLLRRTLGLLATDYTEGRNLADVTSYLILRNIFNKIQTDSVKACRILRVIFPYLVLAGSAYSFTHRLPIANALVRKIWAWVSDPVTSSITIPANSPLNQDMLQWLVANGLGRHPRALTLCTAGTINGAVPKFDFDEYGRPTIPRAESDSHEPEPLQFIPEFGDYTFRRGPHLFTVSREKPRQQDLGMGLGPYMRNGYYAQKQVPLNDDDPSAPQPLFITCFPTLRGAAPIQTLLKEIRGFSKPKQKDTTTMYRPTFTYNKVQWNRGTTRPVRTLHSVAMETAIKDPLVNEITKYLSPEREAWYAARGIPYRKGLLLYGPPGTGKTSFSIALAGHFKLDVYVLSLSDPKTNDGSLEILFDKMPRRCVVLIEDVDCAGLKREQLKAEEEEEKKKQLPGIYGALSQHSTRLTLSGLLNVLDGPCSKEGRILLMTSNNPDSLDAALVRQGRCDHKVLFGYAGREVCEKLFVHLYTKSAGESVADEENAGMHHNIPAMAAEFADQIPTEDSRITPAEVQGFIMLHLEDPVAAVKGAAAWAKEIVETKARGAIVAEFENEIEKKKEEEKKKKEEENTAAPAMPDAATLHMFQRYGELAPEFFAGMAARRNPVADRVRPAKKRTVTRTSASLPPTSREQSEDQTRGEPDDKSDKADSVRGSRRSSPE